MVAGMKRFGWIFLLFMVGNLSQAQVKDRDSLVAQDTTQTKIVIPGQPKSIQEIYTYDVKRNLYIRKVQVGDYEISYPKVLTPKQYFELLRKEQIRENFKVTNDAISGKNKDAQKDILPQFYVNSKFFETIFGGTDINIRPKGTVELDLGLRYSKRNNPMIPVRNRENLGLDMDQRISVGLTGNVGKRLNINLNYDTQSMFQFNNQVKLDFNPDEDAILQKVELGNVSMQTTNSLVPGIQSLIGLRTVMKFGNTEVTLVGAEQKSDMQVIQAQGGEVLEDFEMDILHYDENRHFFLSQYFREQYDQALQQYPFINSNVRVTRIEVWITNRGGNNPDQARNIVAIQDLGESSRLGLSPLPAGFVLSPGALPDNAVNKFNPEAIGTPQSVLNGNIRNIPTVSQGFSGLPVVNGKDYVALENAIKLDSTQYKLFPKLGYISLKRKLNPDEVLAVAFEYTVGNQVYKVGEFTDDGVVYPQTLVVKLLKSNIVDVEEPSWDLMMKNIYAINAYNIAEDDFMLHLLYLSPTPINYINPVNNTPLTADVKEKILLHVFHMDELNTQKDPQPGGDGFFDFIPGITVDPENALIKFTSVEPFGKYLFEKLKLQATEDYDNPSTWNDNQSKYVFKELYTQSVSSAQQYSEKNKFILKGKYKSSMGGGISIGMFNIPRGSVVVTAGGRELVEGVDYVVNYQAGRVEIINPALQSSNIPIQIRVEQNNLFQQSTKIFTGIDVQHTFNENFVLGATYLHLKEKPITWKADYGHEPINNSMFGLNGRFSTQVNFLTKWINYLPNIKTDAPSNFSIKAEIAALKPGLSPISKIGGETATLIEDFESSQASVDISLPHVYKLSPTPKRFPESNQTNDWAYGKNRALLAWYYIDQVFYSNPPAGITNAEMSKDENRYVYITELFDRDVPVGQTNIVNTLNLAYFPDERGPYNFDLNLDPNTGKLLNPEDRWAGIFRPLTTTDFEQSNVQYISFWLMDPYYNNPNFTDEGKIYLNLGYISEDILYDGYKQYENGLPGDGGTSNTTFTNWGKLPLNQALTYNFSDDPAERENQDVGLDGLPDAQEAQHFSSWLNSLPASLQSRFADDPANDDFVHYLNAQGGVVERYKKYNNTEGNTPVDQTTQTNGNEVYPDTEDIDRDMTMNNIDAYYEYELEIKPGLQPGDPYVADVKETTFTDATGQTRSSRWIQFKIPVKQFTSKVGNISDFRSIKFFRIYMTEFSQPAVFRLALLELIRSDWRNYELTLDPSDPNPDDDPTTVEVTSVSSEENQTRGGIPYVSPPGIQREEMYQNNQLVRQNEQALSMKVCDLEPKDARGVFKYNIVDMRQFKRLKMFVHAESVPGQTTLQDDEMYAFIRFGTDITENFYEVQIPLKVTQPGQNSPEEVWPLENRIDLKLELLQKLKLRLIEQNQANPQNIYYVTEDQLDPEAVNKPNKLIIGIKGNPNFAQVKIIMLGVRNHTNAPICGEVWFNELRLTDMKNKGGWATQGAADLQLADVATFNFTGGLATAGFGQLEQGPMGRSVENRYQYSFNTAVNAGKFLPEKWNITLPVNYTVTKEFILPEYDPVHQDILLDDRLAIAQTQQERDSILDVARDKKSYKSIALVGVKKNYSKQKSSTPGKQQKKRMYDIENFTFNFTYSESNHTNFEVAEKKDQTVNFGILYNYNFENKKVFEPFKNTRQKWLRKPGARFIKDFNFNPWPSSITFKTDIDRRFNNFRLRQLEDYGLDFPPMQSRDYKFNLGYTIQYNPFKSVNISFNTTNYRTIKNFILPGGQVDYNAGIWDGFFDIGQPFTLQQNINLVYKLPLDKFPVLNFINMNYTYNGSFQWQRKPEIMANINGYDLGNTIQNANTHQLNGSLDLKKLYKSFGITALQKKWSGKTVRRKKTGRIKKRLNPQAEKSADSKTEKKKKKTSVAFTPGPFHKSVAKILEILTSINRIRVNYKQTNGTFIPGFLPSVGLLGSDKPDIPYVLGWYDPNVRYELAKRGWLTDYPDLNEPYKHNFSEQLDISTNFRPIKNMTIDVKANKNLLRSDEETFLVQNNTYQTLIPRQFGNFSISWAIFPTAFEKFSPGNDPTVDRIFNNTYVIARRLAEERGVPVPASGYPDGYGRFQSEVLTYAFIAAMSKKDPARMKLTVFPDFPIPNWSVKYTGLMRLGWFKKHFKRFSLQHAYRSDLTVNRFQNNLEYFQNALARDNSGNYYSPISYGDIVVTEAFNPLLKVQMEMKNSIQLDFSYNMDRMVSLNTENFTLTRVNGKQITIGMGYRIKDVYLPLKIGGNRYEFKNDLILKADFSFRHNINYIYGLAQGNSQPVNGQDLYNFKLTADYSMTKSLSAIFFYEHSFSKFAVSTAYPLTNIRGGFTIKYTFGN